MYLVFGGRGVCRLQRFFFFFRRVQGYGIRLFGLGEELHLVGGHYDGLRFDPDLMPDSHFEGLRMPKCLVGICNFLVVAVRVFGYWSCWGEHVKRPHVEFDF